MMRSLLFAVCLLSLVAAAPQLAPSQDSSSDQAQSGRHWPTPEEAVSKLDSQLSLSDDQKAKITPIIADRQEKMKALASEGGRRRKKAHEMKSIMDDSDAKIKAVLTDDQKKKYDEIQQQQREQAKQRWHERHSSGSD